MTKGRTTRVRLTADEFRALAYAKGWRLVELARHWDITPVSLSRILNNEARAPVWDDAIRGLPRCGPPIPAVARVARAPRRPAPGLRYDVFLPVGAVVAATGAIGSIADEGQRGIVLARVVEGDTARYRVLFETGGIEDFTPDLVDLHLAVTGLERAELASYRWRDESAAQADLAAGLFVFWP